MLRRRRVAPEASLQHEARPAHAEEHAKKVSKDCILYLQPEWSVSKKITPLIVEYVRKHPKWKISLQTHKYLNIP